jgi:hypothetical protein
MTPQSTQVTTEERPGRVEEEIAVHIAAAGVVRDVIEESGAVRPATSKLFYLFLILITFVAGILSPSSSAAANNTPVPGIPQTDPSTEATMSKKWLFNKRWSCHEPNRKCGPKGCWNQDEHLCCSQPEGKYGLCSKRKGEECCGEMCCSEGTECRKSKDYLCYPKDSSSG